MRLHRLEIEGFGPFRERQDVDFDAFADDGIFLIAGRTGAGKSSILDAVCFGLYGGVPRYDGGDRRLRSDHCEPGDPTEVRVEFSTVAGRFRVTRSPEYERPAKRGGGMTKQAAAASLEELSEGRWVGRAARAVDVAHELEGILQLNMAQFLQVILLAQNRFAEFLHASSKDRQALLRKLFGTERFGDYQARFEERRRASEQALGGAVATVTARVEEGERLVAANDLAANDLGVNASGVPEPGESVPAPEPEPASGEPEPGTSREGRDATTADRIALLRRALDRAAYRSERRTADREDAESRLLRAERHRDEAREQRQAQIERDRARAALAELDAEAPAVAEDRAILDRARAAEAIRPLSTAEQRARKALVEADEVLAVAQESWEETAREAAQEREQGSLDAGPDPMSPLSMREWASARTREVGAWERAGVLEAEAPSRVAAIAEARATAEAVAEKVAGLDRERAGLPAEQDALIVARDDARRLADREADLVRARDDAASRLAGAEDAVRRGTERIEAERVLLERSEEATAAQARVTALRRRRFAGIAGELAAALVPGEACAVCGATEHPHPATHADPVTDEDVVAAEADQERAAAEQAIAATRAAEVAADLAAALARSGGLDVAAAQTALDAVLTEHASAVAAAVAADEAEAALGRARERGAQLDAEHAAALRAGSDAREALTLLERRHADAEEQIAAARGGHESVARRQEGEAVRIAAAGALADALDGRAQRRDALDGALADLRGALDASPFGDARDVEDALRPQAEQRRLEERIARHAGRREKERATLFDLELRMLPDEPLDLAPSEQAADSARTVWAESVDAASRAGAVATQLGALVDAAATAHERSASQAEEHEVLRALTDALAGRGTNVYRMNLETFVLAAELEDIVAAANLRLHDMSSGRYRLVHSDAVAARGAASGLGIVVYDAFTGQTRPAQSLSGGETFLGSLALALGLAEVVTARAGGVRLDTLFIDEGFGSLDGDTLEVAMRTLDELRQGGRTVGVISHVEAMQDQIPAQLTVRTTPGGSSVIDAPRPR
ncbi:exonuclease SbcC [Microbacterium resistens]|uniref:Nuclease SbcCD subunit C n=1 Tax=Microbacterium resistens TaxID=156977 RepID=A0ABU1SAL2_9MICO|nr:SMC family ATPase [Microbacterium resistens]MDR6866657.1 exonuclease SbcC [Microbacterium resistens]